jgi:5-methyltetrahydrofolate--homocysteine methyltransferase
VSVDFPSPVFVEVCISRVLLGDGAMGTELQRAGLPPGQSGELWNLEQPGRVEAIHRAYAEAGSDVVLTNTFGANPWVLGRYQLAGSLEAIARSAAELARRSVPPGVFVLGDIGPTGALPKPLGDATIEQFHDAFLQQAHALLAGSADGIIVETMSAVEEAVAAVRAAREAGAPFVIGSMTFDRTKDGAFRTMMGVRPEFAARALVEAGADIVGANCGTNMAVADYVQLAATLCSAVTCPVMIQPNAGRPELAGGQTVYRLSPADFADAMRGVVKAGARIIGGCCGTTPAHIAAVRQMLDGLPLHGEPS